MCSLEPNNSTTVHGVVDKVIKEPCIHSCMGVKTIRINNVEIVELRIYGFI